MDTRKQFLKKISGGAAALTAGAFFNPLKSGQLKEELDSYSGSAQEIASNEDFWATVQQAFTVDGRPKPDKPE